MNEVVQGVYSLDQFQSEYVRPVEGRTLIVGSHVYGEKEDRRQLYKDVVGADMQAGPGVDLVIDLEEPLPLDLGQFAHVECMSVMEHSRRPWLMAANIERLLVPGGSIFVAVPFVWMVHGYPDDYWRFTISGVKALFPSIDWMATAYAQQTLGPTVPRVKYNGWPYLPRTEVCAFGYKL